MGWVEYLVTYERDRLLKLKTLEKGKFVEKAVKVFFDVWNSIGKG